MSEVRLPNPVRRPPTCPAHLDVDALEADLRAGSTARCASTPGRAAPTPRTRPTTGRCPIGVVVPRDVEAAVAAVAVCRRHGAPLLSRGGGTSLAGAVHERGRGHRLVEVLQPARVGRRRTAHVRRRARHRARPAQRRCSREHRPGVRPATGDARPLHARRDDRQQLVRGHGAAHRQGRRQRRAPGGAPLRRHADVGRARPATRSTPRSSAEGGRRAEVYRQLRDAARQLRRPDPRRLPATSRGGCRATTSTRCCRSRASTSPGRSSAARARSSRCCTPSCGSCRRCRPARWWCSATRTCSPRRRRARRRSSASRSRWRASTTSWSASNARSACNTDGAAPAARRAAPGCWSSSAASDQDEADRNAGRRCSPTVGRARDDDDVAVLRRPRAGAGAVGRCARSALGATARVPGEADTWPGLGGRRGRPGRPRRLPARPVRGSTTSSATTEASLYGHFGQGCVHTRIPFDLLTRRRRGRVPPLPRAGRRSRGLATAVAVGRARRRPGRAASCCPRCSATRSSRRSAQIKAIFDPDDRMNPGKVVAPAPLDADLRLGADYRHPTPSTPHFPYPRRRRRLRTGRAALRRRRASAAARRGGVMCPSYMVTREEEHSTRGRARLLFEMLDGARAAARSPTGGARTRCATRSTCAWRARAASPTARSTSTWPPTRRSSSPTTTPGGSARRAHYSMGWLPLWRRRSLGGARGSAATRLTRRRGLGRAAKRLAGVDPRRKIPRFARETLQHWFADRPAPARRRAAAARSCCGRTRSPTTSTRHVGQAAVEVLEDAGWRVTMPEQPLCCGLTWISTGQLRLAKRVLRRTVDALAEHVRARRARGRARAELHGGVPQRRGRAAARRPRRRSGCAQQTVTLAELLARSHPGLAPAAARADGASSRPTATSTPSWASTPTRRCCATRAPTSTSSTRAAAASPATSASRPATTTCPMACAERVLLRRVRAADDGRRRPRRRLQLPHPDRAARQRRTRGDAPRRAAERRPPWRVCARPARTRRRPSHGATEPPRTGLARRRARTCSDRRAEGRPPRWSRLTAGVQAHRRAARLGAPPARAARVRPARRRLPRRLGRARGAMSRGCARHVGTATPCSRSLIGAQRHVRRHSGRGALRLGRLLRGRLADLAFPVDHRDRHHRVPRGAGLPRRPRSGRRCCASIIAVRGDAQVAVHLDARRRIRTGARWVTCNATTACGPARARPSAHALDRGRRARSDDGMAWCMDPRRLARRWRTTTWSWSCPSRAAPARSPTRSRRGRPPSTAWQRGVPDFDGHARATRHPPRLRRAARAHQPRWRHGRGGHDRACPSAPARAATTTTATSGSVTSASPAQAIAAARAASAARRCRRGSSPPGCSTTAQIWHRPTPPTASRVPDERSLHLPGYPGGHDVARQPRQRPVPTRRLRRIAAALRRCRPARPSRRRRLARRRNRRRRDRHDVDRPDAGIWELDDQEWTQSRLICVAGLRAVSRASAAPTHRAGELAGPGRRHPRRHRRHVHPPVRTLAAGARRRTRRRGAAAARHSRRRPRGRPTTRPPRWPPSTRSWSRRLRLPLPPTTRPARRRRRGIPPVRVLIRPGRPPTRRRAGGNALLRAQPGRVRTAGPVLRGVRRHPAPAARQPPASLRARPDVRSLGPPGPTMGPRPVSRRPRAGWVGRMQLQTAPATHGTHQSIAPVLVSDHLGDAR